MFDESAEYYDLIYLSMKDYAEEAAKVATLLRAHMPHARRVLDVACGTGEHARWLATHGFDVDGVDLNPAFISIARAKHPAGTFFEADMRDFHLGRRYDAVVCLFSSIGYARTSEGIESTLRCCREHLVDDGVVIVEPWFPPGVLDTTRVSQNEGRFDAVHVIRECRIDIHGAISRLNFTYTITDHGRLRQASEVHELGIFTRDEMLQSFRAAGLDASHDADGLIGRGLYVARPAARDES
jgi:SAM-dependent methyltransferase